MLNLLSFALELINERTIWLYAACLLVVLFYVRAFLRARGERDNTVFTIEKEVAAHREGRAMSAIGLVFGVAVVITAVKFYLVPTVDLEALAPRPTPTLTLPLPTRVLATMTPTSPAATNTPAPTSAVARPEPTRAPLPTLPPPTVAPAPVAAAPAACSNPSVQITSPGMNATLSGRVAVSGIASGGNFQFYKVEYGQGEQPGSWHVISDVHRSPVGGGVLEEFDTRILPNGVYWLQLTVVDKTGNFTNPCRVRVVIQN